MSTGFLFLLSYINVVLRYSFITILILIMVINYKNIFKHIQGLINIKKNR